MDLNSLLVMAAPLGAGVLRNVAGYLENSAKANSWQSYDWGQLVGTILEVGVISVAAMYGLNMDATQAAGVGVVGSFLFSAIKKAKVSSVVVPVSTPPVVSAPAVTPSA